MAWVRGSRKGGWRGSGVAWMGHDLCQRQQGCGMTWVRGSRDGDDWGQGRDGVDLGQGRQSLEGSRCGKGTRGMEEWS